MRVITRVEGVNPPEWLRSRTRLAARAISAGVDAASKGQQHDIRAMISRAGMGTRLGNAVRQFTYPRPPSYSPRAAADVVANRNAADIIQAFSAGATIRARGGRYLAVPTQAVPRGRWGEKLSPEQAKMRFLRPLERRILGGKLALVLPDATTGRKTGRARNATANQIARGKSRAVVMYWLVDEVRLGKRLSPQAVAAGWARRLPSIIDRAAAGLRG